MLGGKKEKKKKKTYLCSASRLHWAHVAHGEAARKGATWAQASRQEDVAKQVVLMRTRGASGVIRTGEHAMQGMRAGGRADGRVHGRKKQ